MSKLHYYIETPHGIIQRKSDRVYTHAVYGLQTEKWSQEEKKYIPCEPLVCNVQFCGRYQLALAAKAQRAHASFIVETTLKGAKKAEVPHA